jgi:hypothetical protein
VPITVFVAESPPEPESEIDPEPEPEPDPELDPELELEPEPELDPELEVDPDATSLPEEDAAASEAPPPSSLRVLLPLEEEQPQAMARAHAASRCPLCMRAAYRTSESLPAIVRRGET